ncbi:Gifsy-2 prophage tail fiber protein [Salmonella enterica subsp. enterica serovar Typhi]|nr:Gifsy-2 prophage tail fiber protein [Salmonella enterica subsp. enterica serovar Typhi]
MPVSRYLCIFINVGLGEAAKRNVGTGDNQIPDMGAFASGSGWFRLPGGYIVQFGTFSGNTTRFISGHFPIPFPLMAKHLAAPDPHSQYAQKESPTFTGTPKAPTPAAGNNTTQVATTAFVQAALTAIINGAPATLDTLKEIAVAINNDPKFSTTINNALALKAPLLSPALTGTPTAPTAAQSVNNTQIATTAFVKSAIAAMVGSAPAALDTLNELAAALGNDPNFATTMLNALAGKQPLDNTLTNLSGKDVAGLLAYLGLGEGSALPVGVPVPWPSATPPTGWLKCNGAAFSAEEYPELAKVYPTNKLPDLRGEFIRGWDDGRGVDAGRQLLSSQGDAIRNIEGFADGGIGMSFDAIRGAFYDAGTRSARMPNNTTDIGKTDDLGFDASRVVPTANENRPRNIAFNYIVRAA